MEVTKHQLHTPDLFELAAVIEKALKANYKSASATVESCPDLRNDPFYLAAQGLSGNECIADVGGQPNLFPVPNLEARYSLMALAKAMNLSFQQGMLIGAGAGPFYDVGVNCELSPNLAWKHQDDGSGPIVINLTRVIRVTDADKALCQISESLNCALMVNLYGSDGATGPVLKLDAKNNAGGQSFTECIRLGVLDHYGTAKPISMGGVFVMKAGLGKYHVMPDFPSTDCLPFQDRKEVDNWLTWHKFQSPMVCLSVLHTHDPGQHDGLNLGLRMEHTHCFAAHRDDRGGHYHNDLQDGNVEEVEYEGYFNVAKLLYRIDQPKAM